MLISPTTPESSATSGLTLEISADTAPTVHATFRHAPERKRRARRRNIHKKKRSPVFKNKRPKPRGPEERQHDLKRKTGNDQDVRPEPAAGRLFRLVKVGIGVFALIGFAVLFLRLPKSRVALVAGSVARYN